MSGKRQAEDSSPPVLSEEVLLRRAEMVARTGMDAPATPNLINAALKLEAILEDATNKIAINSNVSPSYASVATALAVNPFFAAAQKVIRAVHLMAARKNAEIFRKSLTPADKLSKFLDGLDLASNEGTDATRIQLARDTSKRIEHLRRRAVRTVAQLTQATNVDATVFKEEIEKAIRSQRRTLSKAESAIVAEMLRLSEASSSSCASSFQKRSALPNTASKILNDWFVEHFAHPYPTDDEKAILAAQAGIEPKQVTNWFSNVRVRLWRPTLDRMKESTPEVEESPSHVCVVESPSDEKQ
jgi:hypothetical protein